MMDNLKSFTRLSSHSSFAIGGLSEESESLSSELERSCE